MEQPMQALIEFKAGGTLTLDKWDASVHSEVTPLISLFQGVVFGELIETTMEATADVAGYHGQEGEATLCLRDEDGPQGEASRGFLVVAGRTQHGESLEVSHLRFMAAHTEMKTFDPPIPRYEYGR